MPRPRFIARPAARALALAVALGLVALAGTAPAASAREVYITNLESASVSVLDSRTNQPVGDPIPVGEKPDGMALTPDGSTLVTGSDDGTIKVWDLKNLP